MGNAHAASSLNPFASPPPMATSVTLDADDKLKQSSQGSPTSAGAEQTSENRHPGTYEDLHKKTKDVLPIPFEGLRAVISKGLSNHFQVNHTITISQDPRLTGYRFGATYVGENMVGPGEAYPVLFGDIDPNFNVSGQIMHQLHPRVKTKLISQIQDSRCVAVQSSTDYRSDNATSSITLVNIDLIGNSGLVIGQHLHKVTDSIDLGAEVICQYGPQIPGKSASIYNFAARYTSPSNFTASATLGLAAAHLCYYQKANENVQFGVELEAPLMQLQESVATFGYQVEVPKADLLFKASVNSNLQVTGTVEKKLMPLPLTFMLSAQLDHGAKQGGLKLGAGVTLG